MKGDATEFLARYGIDYGFTPTQPLVVHVADAEMVARASLSQNLGLKPPDVDAFFTDNLDTQIALAPSNQIEAFLYLPNVASNADLRQALAFDTSSYALRLVGNGTETSDVYPYWFWRGFENYQEVRLAGAASSRQQALQDLKAGRAPALSAIARYTDAQGFTGARKDGQAILDRRGEATIEFLVQKYGERAVGRLLVSSGSTIDRFNSVLQQISGMSLDQRNSALDVWLQQ